MKRIYAIRDRVALDLVGMHMYLLMCFRTDQEAARYFADAINDTTSILNKHPGDYELIYLGNVDPEGNLDALTGARGSPQIIITGDALVGLQQPALVKEA